MIRLMFALILGFSTIAHAADHEHDRFASGKIYEGDVVSCSTRERAETFVENVKGGMNYQLAARSVGRNPETNAFYCFRYHFVFLYNELVEEGETPKYTYAIHDVSVEGYKDHKTGEYYRLSRDEGPEGRVQQHIVSMIIHPEI